MRGMEGSSEKESTSINKGRKLTDNPSLMAQRIVNKMRQGTRPSVRIPVLDALRKQSMREAQSERRIINNKRSLEQVKNQQKLKEEKSLKKSDAIEQQRINNYLNSLINDTKITGNRNVDIALNRWYASHPEQKYRDDLRWSANSLASFQLALLRASDKGIDVSKMSVAELNAAFESEGNSQIDMTLGMAAEATTITKNIGKDILVKGVKATPKNGNLKTRAIEKLATIKNKVSLLLQETKYANVIKLQAEQKNQLVKKAVQEIQQYAAKKRLKEVTDEVAGQAIQKAVKESLSELEKKTGKKISKEILENITEKSVGEVKKDILNKKIIHRYDTSILKSELNINKTPMDKIKFQRIKSIFEKNGGVIDQSEEAQRFLEYRGAEAATFNEKVILMKLNPSASDVFEELIHTAQYRAGKIPDQTVLTILKAEIEAAEKLVKYSKQYGIPNSETLETIQRLERMKIELSNL